MLAMEITTSHLAVWVPVIVVLLGVVFQAGKYKQRWSDQDKVNSYIDGRLTKQDKILAGINTTMSTMATLLARLDERTQSIKNGCVVHAAALAEHRAKKGT